MSTVDPWKLDEGLFSDYNGEVVDAWFATDAMYNNGQTMRLYWKMTTDNPEAPEHTQAWNVGDGYRSDDGGKTCYKEENPKKNPHMNSAVGKLMTQVFELGAEKDLKSRSDIGIRDSKIWLGSRWYMGTKEFNYGGEIGTRSMVLPTEYQGFASGGSAASQTAQKTNPAPQPVATGSFGLAEFQQLDGALVTAITQVAKDSEDAPNFLNNVIPILDQHGQVGNDSLVGWLSDETTYKELHG